MSSVITLESRLEERAKNEEDAATFWSQYSAMRDYLAREYYPWVQSRCPFYTDHGEGHVKSVIQAASALLENKLGSEKGELSSLDLFLLLSSIIWHDVGMVHGRVGHAREVTRMTESIKTIAFSNLDIYRIVTSIVQAHTGKAGIDIPSREEDCTTPDQRVCIVYPKALSALIRFADEISENRNRISQELLPSVPEEQKIFWEYANCVSASRPDPSRERVVITLSIQQDKAVQAFQCDEFLNSSDNVGEISLIEYIIRRIEKMNNERAYCAPYFGRYVWIGELVVRFRVFHGTTPLDEYNMDTTFGDSHYAQIDIFDRFFQEHPDWRPEELGRRVV